MGTHRLGPGLEHSSGFALTWTGQKVFNRQTIEINDEDAKVLRELALRVAEIAEDPIQDELKKLWYDHNDLKNTRPVIMCDPQNSWYELIPPHTLRCRGNLAKLYEFRLLKDIYRYERIKDDTVITKEFSVQYVFTETGRGKQETIITNGDVEGAFNWEPAIKDYSELDEMYFNRFVIDYDKTNQQLELIRSIFGDVLNVKLEGCWWWSLGMTWEAVYLVGMEKLMMDMFDEPEGVHKLMKFLCDERSEQLDFVEKNGLLTLNNAELYFGSGGYGWTHSLPQKDFEPKHIRTQDLWAFSESQETVGISPAMFEEFIFPYQLKLMERFGLIYYGCCEAIHQRWNVIKSIPDLRRVAVSPWSDEEKMSEYLQDDYVLVRKTPPTWVAQPVIDEDYIRAGLKKTVELAKKNYNHLEIFMKDTHTISDNPRNITRFVELAREMSEKY